MSQAPPSPMVPTGGATSEAKSKAAQPHDVGANTGVVGEMVADPTAADPDTLGMPLRFGKYTLIRKLATGGMAELFLAIQKSVAGFEKLLVIKRILPSMNQDRAFIDMLLHEARIAATLSHPNVVQIFDVGQHDGQYFIAMEHVHGEDLRSIVRQMKKMHVTEFPLEHALAIVLGMCAGLAYAHERRDLQGNALNIVHRDISPQNVVVTFSGDVKIVDFGIAKSSNRDGEITKSGKLKGKVSYMSPEQARGEAIDARSDVFATGVMLFELTTGKRLFKGSSEYETLRLICERDYPLPSEVRPNYPKDLERIVTKALAKDKNDRYQSAREMQADIEAFVRRHRIAVSNIALHQFMQTLFEEKLALQKEALQQGKQLADIIEMQHAMSTPPEADVDGTGVLRAMNTQSMPAAARTVTDINAEPHRKRNAIFFFGFAALALGAAAAVVGFVFTNRRDTTSTITEPPVAPVVAKGSLVVESTPPGASIWLNGDLRAEVTPATIPNLPTGVPLDIKLTMDGFEHVKQQVTLKGTEPERVELALNKGSVVVVAKVTPAALGQVFLLDGKPVKGPKIEGVTSGVSHTLVVAAPGFVDQSVSFTGNPLETKSLDVTLQRADAKRPVKMGDATTPNNAAPAPAGHGKLNVGASNGWCNVSVDGVAKGATPIAGVELDAGTHKLSCTTADGKTQTATVAVPADGVARYKFAL